MNGRSRSHASMAGACAVVDAKPDGATVWTGTQKPHYAQIGVAKLLGLPVADVHVIWTRGPGSYGRNDAGDATMDAAFLSRATGRPVRVQYMRDDRHRLGPERPRVRPSLQGCDRRGRIGHRLPLRKPRFLAHRCRHQ